MHCTIPSHQSLLKSIHIEYSSNNVRKCSRLTESITRHIETSEHVHICSFHGVGRPWISPTTHFGSTPLDIPPSLELFRALSTKTEIVTG